MNNNRTITLAWTGASGAPYGLRLLQCLLAADYQVYLLISSAARVVLATEHGLKLPANPEAAQAALVEHLAAPVISWWCAEKKIGFRQWLPVRLPQADGGVSMLGRQCSRDCSWHVR